MKRTAFAALLVFLVMNAANGLQRNTIGNRPDPREKYPQKEINALYRKALKDDALPKGAIELELVRKIPLESEIDEKEIYFRGVNAFSIDQRGHVYIPQGYLKIVYEFDRDGKLFSRYAKAGQGPGEMNYPQDVFFFRNEVALHEAVIQKMNFFDREWTYLRSIPTKGCHPFAVASNGDIFGFDTTREKLISVLNTKGQLTRRFGEPRFSQKPRSPLNGFIAELSPSGSVWVCFSALGIIRKFSMSGELLKEIDFAENMSEMTKDNIKENFKLDRKRNQEWISIFVSIAFLNNDVLITCGGVMNPIYRLGEDGTIKAVYFIKPEYQISRDCQFASIGENHEELFYVKTRIGDFPAIGVYRPKRQDGTE